MKKTTLLKSMLLLCALVVGSMNSWADTTYKLTKVTSVSAGNKYVFEQNSHVLSNTVDSKALQTTDTYSKSGLNGDESYIWLLESATGGFYLKNVSLNSDQYLNNASSTTMTFGSSSSIWTIAFTNGVALISNTSNGDRYLGDTGDSTPAHTYKAYASINLPDKYPHDFTVYLVEEEIGVTSLSVKTAPTKTRYEVGEDLDMTGLVLDADGSDVSSGYTMKIGGSNIEDGDELSSQGKKTITIYYGGTSTTQAISVGAVTGIEVTTAPTKTTYNVGDTFDATGMEVTASLSTGELSDPDTWTKTVTTYTVTPSTAFVGSETYVTISYAGQTTTQDITVNAIHVSSVSLNKTSTSITCGGTETLTATISPDNADDKSVTWSSDNETVATVDNDGKVTAKAVGTANITVTTVDLGKTATCEVTVTADESKPALIDVVLEETFAAVTETGAVNGSNFDNTGWTVTGYVYGSSTGSKAIRMAKGDGAGSITTPALTGMETGATLSFYAYGWASSEKEISLSGTNCTLSTTSFTDLPYSGGDFAKKTVTVTVTGANPTITFSAASGKRVHLKDIVISQPKSTVDVTLNASGFASYCSPFALDLTPTSDYAAYAVAAAGDNALTFTKIPGKVAANTPIILYSGTIVSDEVSIPVIEDDDPAIAAVSGNELIGTLSPTYVTATSGHTNYGLKGDKFIRFNAGAVKANKAYLSVDNSKIDASAHEIAIIFDNGDVTGIEEMKNQKTIDGGFYNLAGQRVAQPTKGLYIINGKKVIFK